MNYNPLYSFFPKTDKIKEMRSNQKEALDKIWDLLNSGITKIILEAPVGSGKSAIADTLFNYYNEQGISTLYTSPLNALVDQVDTSGFQNITTLKGKSHYPCKAGRLNCSQGFCNIKKCPSGTHKRNCAKKLYDGCNRCICWKCEYKKVFREFKSSMKGNTNFTLFMMGITNMPGVIVFDECDEIEDSVRSFRSVTIPILINIPEFKNHIPALRQYSDKLTEEYKKIDPESSEANSKKYDELKNLSDHICMMLGDYEIHNEDWCISVKPVTGITKYEPVTIDRFLEPLLQNNIVIMMSATPQIIKGYSKIEVDSIFPKESRHWAYKPLGKMSKNYRDKTIPKVANWLHSLDGKTLVHCISYKTAESLSIPLKMLGSDPYLQIPNKTSNGNNYSRYDAVEAFTTAKDLNKILLSVKLDRGVDFWNPEIINNVIAVLPWANPTDPLTNAKNKVLGKEWQNEQMARDIMQQYGRIHRNEKNGIYKGLEKPKRTYIIDSNFSFWYSTNKKYFAKWFKEAQLK